MKKLILTIATCIIATSLFAQESSPVNFGVKTGLVSTKTDTRFTGVSSVKENARTGMMLGAFLRVNWDKWYLQPELSYVAKKSRVKLATRSYDVKLKSLDVPVLLGYKIVKMPTFNLRAFLGPVASFKIDDSLERAFRTAYRNTDFKGAVFNAKFGAGIDVWKFTLDVDYEAGLSNVASNYFRKNNMVNVTLGFKIL